MLSKILFTSLLTTLLSSTLFAKSDTSLVEEYMHVSGATIMIESMGEQVTSSMQQSKLMYGEEVDQSQLTFVKRAFNPYDDTALVARYLQEHFDNGQLKQIIAYYKTEIGKKVTQAGIDALSPNAQSELLAFMSTLQATPPTQKRIQTIKSVIDELQLTKTTEDLLGELMVYFNAKSATPNKLSAQNIMQFKLMMRQTLKQQLFVSTLFTYRDISNQELQKVINFYHTPAGKSEMKIFSDALLLMLKSGFTKALAR